MYGSNVATLQIYVLYYCQLSLNFGFFPHVKFCMGFSPGLYRVSTDLNQLPCDSSLAPGFIHAVLELLLCFFVSL